MKALIGLECGSAVLSLIRVIMTKFNLVVSGDSNYAKRIAKHSYKIKRIDGYNIVSHTKAKQTTAMLLYQPIVQ